MRFIAAALLAALVALPAGAQAHEITTSGTRFLLDGRPFPYTGVTFFNAIYNSAFNQSSAERVRWMGRFKKYGITVLRIWGQWDSKRGFADNCPECSLYYPDGRLRQPHLDRLKQIAADADSQGMVIELTLFAFQSWREGMLLPPEAMDRALTAITREMRPYRNVTFQVWNEFSDHVIDHVKSIRAADPKRLVTNCPGYASELGDTEQNRVLDYLTPHTSRQNAGRHWEIAPAEVAYLLARWGKPVVDDEPARNGTPDWGGPRDRTWPYDQIIQIYKMWQAGAYVNYHHDMFQTGYGSPAVPANGIPDPEFNPYHRLVFEFLAQRDRYLPPAR